MNVRRFPLMVVLLVGLVVTGTVSALSPVVKPKTLPSALSVSGDAESTALFCTGLSSVRGGVAGRVTFINTTSSSRAVDVIMSSNTGARSTRRLHIVGYGVQSLSPGSLSGQSFGVEGLVSGGGVVGVEVASAHTAEAPCVSTGVKNWYATGFTTTVGSYAGLSIYNPTATPAVLDVSTYSPSGFVAPAPYQGIAVAPHAQVELNLGSQIVATTNFGVHVNVLRGYVVAVGVQESGPVVSFNPGVTSAVSTVLFPRVTTANGASAQIRVSNPSGRAANVTLDIALAPYAVRPETLTVAPYSSGELTVTPNPAVPAAGYASVELRTTQPLITSLATGSGSNVALSSPGATAREFVIGDFYGQGYDAAALTNTSEHPMNLNFTNLPGPGERTLQSSATLAGHTTRDIKYLYRRALRHTTVLVTASEPALQVTLTLPTNPIGMTVVSPLDGR